MLRTLFAVVPLALLPVARAVGTVQDLWNSPVYPDYTTNYTAGTTIVISWQHALAGQFAAFCPDCDITNVDLWITGSSYTRKLEAGVDVNTTTSYTWKINLDNDDVEASTDWTFRFLPADSSWGSDDEEISSAKFNLEPSDDDTSSSTTSSTTTTSTSTSTSTTTSTSTPDATTSTSATPTADPVTGDNTTEKPNDDDGLSSGAKAGIGVGVGAGAIILAVLAFFLWRRLKAAPKAGTGGPEAAAAGYKNINGVGATGEQYPVQQDGAGYFAPPMTKAGFGPGVGANTMGQGQPQTQAVSELVGDHAGEMDAGPDAQRPPVELDGGSYPARR
ncbi:hypothetical protein BDV18DRAFT_48109 [Aspergillus unguis]